MKKTLIFGGTFNPPHFGHLKLMDEAARAVSPYRVIVMPTHLSPHKCDNGNISDEDRLAMCRLAFGGKEGVSVSDFEVKKGGKSYTVLTLQHLHEAFPDEELYFAMGSDMLISFLRWRDPERIMELASLVCCCRNGNEREAAERAKAEIEGRGGRCILCNSEPLVCSSSEIRRKIADNEPISGVLPDAVDEYIRRKGLYRD